MQVVFNWSNCKVHFYAHCIESTAKRSVVPFHAGPTGELVTCRLRQTFWPQITWETVTVELIWSSLTLKECSAGYPHAQSSSLTFWQVTVRSA